jgi:putative ABC transport system substrate-binding protein
VANLNLDLMPKRLELLHELLPSVSTMAILVNPTSVLTEALLRDLGLSARTMGLQIPALHATTEHHFDKIFATAAELRTGGLVVSPDSFFIGRGSQLGALTARHAMPAISQFREFVAAGGLMSYGTSLTDAVRLAGVYIGRILKGENPASLPIQQATKVELIINTKTAKALGLTLPLALLGRADEVIE